MDFLTNLSMRYNALTKQGKKLADFIRENPDQAIRMTAKALGQASGTSAAAVVRLSQQLGYDGFEQMKISYAKALSDKELNAPIDLIISPIDTTFDIAQKLCHIQTNAVQETLALIDYGDIHKVVTLLEKSRRIHLFGVGSSGLAAQELCHRLNRIGKTCVFLIDGHTNLEYISSAEKRDVVVCFSYSGETKEVYLAAETAHKRGVPVVVVTRNRASTLSEFATIAIRIPDIEKRVRVGAITSITSQMYICDVLYMSLIQRDLTRYEDVLLDTSRIANRLRE